MFVSTSPGHTVTLPVFSDFNNDVPGMAPVTGDINQPTSIYTSPETSVLVQSDSNGISSQSITLNDNGAGDYTNVSYGFSLIEDFLRVEATVSFNSFFDAYFLQAGISDTGPVVTRLMLRSNGEIQAEANQSNWVRLD